MLTLAESRDRIGLVIPVHFPPTVPEAEIRAILERTFTDQDLFCHRHRVVAVVDQGTAAERVLGSARPDSPLFGIPLCRLDRNLGKAGAIRQGLSTLLENPGVIYLATRDCDGDNLVEDLPRMVSLAEHASQATGNPNLTVVGSRPSLHKPMNWEREQWEHLTNDVTLELINLALNRSGRVIDRRFWGDARLDLQSGSRLYSRPAAQLAVEALSGLPEDREIYLMACEMVPCLTLLPAGGIFAQVERLTRVEQPVSSYAGLPFDRCYGRLLSYMTAALDLSPSLALRVFDNFLVHCPGFFSAMRPQLLSCRSCLVPDAPDPLMSPFL